MACNFLAGHADIHLKAAPQAGAAPSADTAVDLTTREGVTDEWIVDGIKRDCRGDRHRQAMHAFMTQRFAEIRQELSPRQPAELEERFRKRGRRIHGLHEP